MLIGIDGNEANVEKRVGIGEYAYELLLQFNIKYQISNIKYIIYLKEKPLPDMPKGGPSWKYRVIGPRKLWTQIALPLDLFFHKPRPNVFFTPSHYSPRFSPVPTSISIMDLSYIHYPELFKKSDLYQLINWTKYSIRRASKIFTISRASKDDIIREYNVPENKVVVTYPGVKKMANSKWQIANSSKMGDLVHQNASSALVRKNASSAYILFVGTLQPRKNIVRLVEAFSNLSKKYPNIKLLIVGKKGWLYEEILDSPKKFGVSDRVEFLDFVKDEDLPSIYKNAICFVLPSFYEGFGLPVLEAMKYGCPLILSNVSSLPEAGEDAALYVDPLDVNDIEEKIERLISNPKLRKEMIKKGYERVKNFSWEKTAKQTLEALSEIAK